MKLARVTFTLALLAVAGCASGPGLGRVGAVTIELPRPDGQVRHIRGRDCTGMAFGGRVRETSVETALRHALDEAQLPATTPVYNVQARERGSFPEACLEVSGVVLAGAQ